MTTTKEISRDGYDLVMTSERDGFTASVYRKGGQVPLSRKLVRTEAEAEKMLAKFIAGAK